MSNRQQGFTLIELMIVVAIIAIIAAIAIPNLQQARAVSNESSAVSSLRAVSSVQEQYRSRFGVFSSTLTDLSTQGFIDSQLGSGTKSGYNFENFVASGSLGFSLEANPQTPGMTGNRFFFVDESGVIRFATSSAASATDQPID